ncbi:metalloregulator ArsR/SmtB family transcription factor [soil metagenome]
MQDKREEFGKRKQQLALFAKALSHPARIAILRQLGKDQRCTCGDLVKQLPLSQSTVSQHLHELKESRLISMVIEGPKSYYSINDEVLEHFHDEFNRLMLNLKLGK